MKTLASLPDLQRKLLERAIKVLVLIVVISFVGYTIYTNWQILLTYEWDFNYAYLFLAALAMILTFSSNVIGWAVIAQQLGGPQALLKNVEIYCLAAHSKRLPGLFWYVAGRAYLYERESIPISVVIQGSLWEMSLLLLSGLVVYMAFLPFYCKLQYQAFNYILLAIIPLLLIVLSQTTFDHVLKLLSPKKKNKIVKVAWEHKLLWFMIYVIGWLAGGLMMYFLAKSLLSSVSLSFLPACWGFVALSGVVSAFAFFLPGGIGIREISLSLLFEKYLPLSVAMMLSILFRVWILVGETLLLVIFWAISKRNNPKEV
jgi:glycosyltransferase 2 family protein